MSEIKEESEFNLDEVEFRTLTAAEYIENLEDEDMRKAIRSQIAPMCLAMPADKRLSPKKLLLQPSGKVINALRRFNQSQGLDTNFLGKK